MKKESKKINKKNRKKGFTLVEVLLYVAAVTVIFSGVTGVSFLILQSRIKTQVMNEVNYQGEQVVQLISQEIRNAEVINNPDKQSESLILSVDSIDLTKNPVVFKKSGNKIVIEEGGSGEVDLTNSQLIVSDLEFQNNGLENAPDSVQFKFKLDFNNLEGRNEYKYSKYFYGTASIRK